MGMKLGAAPTSVNVGASSSSGSGGGGGGGVMASSELPLLHNNEEGGLSSSKGEDRKTPSPAKRQQNMRSWLQWFERDFMIPIFGGTTADDGDDTDIHPTLSPSDSTDVLLNMIATRRLHYSPTPSPSKE